MFFIVFFLSGTCTPGMIAALVFPDNLGRKCVLPDTETPVKGPFYDNIQSTLLLGMLATKKENKVHLHPWCWNLKAD